VLALALLLCAPTLELSAGLRDELRFREHFAGDISTAPVAFDIQVEPSVGLRLETPRVVLTLIYDPRLLAREPYARNHTETLQRASGSLDLQLSRHWHLSAGEYFSYGDYDISSLIDVFNPVTGKIDSLPNVSTLLYRSTYSQGSLGFQASREVGLRLLASYSDSGGIGAAALAAVPEEKNGHEELAISALVARADALVTIFAGNQVEFSTGQRYVGGEISELYQHRFSRFTELDLTAGAQVLRAQVAPGTPFHWDVFPEATVAVTHTVALGALGNVATLAPVATDAEQALELRANVSTGPYFDRTTGQVYDRVSTDIGLTYRFSRRWSLELRGGVALSLKSPRATQDVLALGQLGFVYRIAPYLTLEAGARELVDTYLYIRGATAEQWLTFIAFTFGVKGKV